MNPQIVRYPDESFALFKIQDKYQAWYDSAGHVKDAQMKIWAGNRWQFRGIPKRNKYVLAELERLGQIYK